MVGQTLGKYRVEERVGRGGMGTVYRAVDETLHREVALKVLNTDLNDQSVGRRFRAEAVAIARLNHPGIATIYELLEHDGQWLMVMEFVRGETLEDLVLRAGPQPPARAIDFVSQALAALGHAHRMGVIHRDLKPGNLMLAESGRLKVMDFGIARVAGTEHLTSAGFMMGTPAYMAPEQVLGREVDARADLFAMGCVLYFLLSARLPFEGTTPMETAQSRLRDEPTPILSLRADLPPWIADILMRVLARDPADRFQHADEFRDALARGTSGLPIAPPGDPMIDTVLPGALPAAATAMPTPSASVPRPAAPPENLSTAETQLLGTGPRAMPDRASTSPAGAGPSGPVSVPFDPNTAETMVAQAPPAVRQSQPVPIVPPTVATPAAPRRAARAGTTRPQVSPYAIGGAAAVAAVLLAVWLWPRSAPSPEPAPAVPPAAADPAPPPSAPPDPAPTVVAQAEPPPVVTPPPAPTAADPATSGNKPAPPATSSAGTAAASRGARRPPPEIVITFDRVRMLRITGRRAEDVDAELQFGNGHAAILPKRESTPGIAHAYKDVLRATYVRGRDPQWAPTLPVPPNDLDMPSGFLGRRSDRHWLTLQGQTWFLIVSLDDSNWEQVLHTVTERTRVKIDRPAPARD